MLKQEYLDDSKYPYYAVKDIREFLKIELYYLRAIVPHPKKHKGKSEYLRHDEVLNWMSIYDREAHPRLETWKKERFKILKQYLFEKKFDDSFKIKIIVLNTERIT